MMNSRLTQEPRNIRSRASLNGAALLKSSYPCPTSDASQDSMSVLVLEMGTRVRAA